MKKFGKKKYVGFLVLCLILASLLLFIGFGVPEIMKQNYTEERTNEYTATFKRIESENSYYLIFVEEYSCALQVEPIAIINRKSVEALKPGDKIVVRSFFHIEKFSEDRMSQVTIVSLKANNVDIITLESSRNAVTEADIKIKVTATVIAVCFLIGAIICILYIAGVLKPKQKAKSE